MGTVTLRSHVAAVLALVLLLGTTAAGAMGQTPRPPYPSFPASSCFPPGQDLGLLVPSAPSYLPPPPAIPARPAVLLRRQLQRFGDPRVLRGARLGPLPASMHVTAPRNSLWLHLELGAETDPARLGESRPPQARVRSARASWEAELFARALRDQLCTARTAPLVGWSENRLSNNHRWVAKGPVAPTAFGERFPSPPRRVLLARLRRAAVRYRFSVLEARLLQPLQGAPLLVLKTSDPRGLAKNTPAIMAQLVPIQGSERFSTFTYEGLYLEAHDGRGRPFMVIGTLHRAGRATSQWGLCEAYLPFFHSQTLGSKPDTDCSS